METITKTQLKRIFIKNQFSEDDVQFITDLMEDLSKNQEEQFLKNKDFFLNKNDKIELIDKINITKDDLVEKINNTRSELIERINNTRSELIERINNTRSELIEIINNTKDELVEKINSTKDELVEKINNTKFDLIRWGVGLSLVQLIAIIGALFAMMRAFVK